MKRLVRDLIRQKGLHAFASVAPKSSIFEALNVLERTKCSAVLVITDTRLQGIFSEKDFARACIKRGIQLSSSVESVMTSKVYYVEPTFTLEDCLQVMSKVHVRHLPVVEDGKPIAFLSMRHIMEILVEDKEAQIRELTTYITGSYQIVASTQDQNRSQVSIYHTSQHQEAT